MPGLSGSTSGTLKYSSGYFGKGYLEPKWLAYNSGSSALNLIS